MVKQICRSGCVNFKSLKGNCSIYCLRLNI